MLCLKALTTDPSNHSISPSSGKNTHSTEKGERNNFLRLNVKHASRRKKSRARMPSFPLPIRWVQIKSKVLNFICSTHIHFLFNFLVTSFALTSLWECWHYVCNKRWPINTFIGTANLQNKIRSTFMSCVVVVPTYVRTDIRTSW